ncbi:pyocin knob domain-containing protein [Bacillus velezensis]|uniref:pyocin knob domain-containing protein n=1 Tax=Bacillus velezensis TaxID=492670 RepID=UPI00280EACD1|nr:pyocin knob domain-containing protein [Bacillus velezensis]MDQ9146577.1 pyocin knob domain-containing protein [Bacillus velezensis]MEC2188624.1 pyocin knob domain-containing protein [Bacillus velezensis]
MAYEEKTDWLPDDPINEDDVNRWEKGIKDAHTDLAAHKNDMNNPHKTTKAQIGLGNVDNVQQAAKKDFDQHNQDLDRHVTKAEKDTWNAGQLFKLTEDNGLAKYRSGTDFNTVTDTGLYYMSSVTTALNAPVNNNGYLFVHNYGTYAYQEYTSYSSSDSTSSGRRKFMRNKISGSDSWTSWREFESVEGSQSKVDAHANKTDIHVTKSDKDKWNNAQLNKISNDDGQPLFNVTTDLHAELLNYPSLTYFSYEKTAANTPPAGGRGFWTCSVGKSYGHVLAMTNDNRTFRKSLANNVWSDWVELDNTEAVQKLVDAHANKKDIHVTQADKNMWNGAQLLKITNDNGGYLLTIGDDDNFLEKIVKNGRAFGTFYSTGKAADSPSSASTRGMFHFTSLDSEGKGTFGYVIAVDYKNNMFTNYLDLNLGWQGWRRLITELDTENVPWINVPYKNGAKSGDRPLQYRKVGNTLHLNGHVLTDREVVFGSVPSSCAPAKGVVTMVAASGTTGYSKFIIYSNGDMKLTGIMANIESNVNGYYIDLVLALT